MSDMWLPADEDPRVYVPFRGERENVLGYLSNYRIAFELKCQGLDAEQLARRSVPPSTMSLLGLLRHLARVENQWFQRVLQGRTDAPRLYDGGDDRDLDFDGAVADPAVVEEAWASWRREVRAAEEWAALDVPFDQLLDHHGEQVEVRDVLVHMVEEYARHVGHADLLRECVDGRTGQ
ncbi:DinB family protein [Angustibacter peucedani]